MYFEENMEADHGVASHLQGGKSGGDDEMVIFFGGGDLRAAEDRKHMKTVLGAFSPRCRTMTTSSEADDPRMMMKTMT
jgi:hypothetical protein